MAEEGSDPGSVNVSACVVLAATVSFMGAVIRLSIGVAASMASSISSDHARPARDEPVVSSKNRNDNPTERIRLRPQPSPVELDNRDRMTQ